MKILIIGGGNMGTAIVEGLLAHDQVGVNKLVVCERDMKRRVKLRTLGVEVKSDILPGITKDAQVIILAVKPTDFTNLLAELKPQIEKQQLVISIAAGITLKTIQKGLDHQKVVRVMPNTPALIREGISGWMAAKKVTAKEKKITKQILQALGDEIEVSREGLIDAVTALSGSGPAYVFLFLESLIAGGIKLGLDKKQAEKLAMKTLLGAGELAQISKDDLKTLRERVTSKGGTTEAALKFFQQKKFTQVVEGAMGKAYRKSKELAKG